MQRQQPKRRIPQQQLPGLILSFFAALIAGSIQAQEQPVLVIQNRFLRLEWHQQTQTLHFYNKADAHPFFRIDRWTELHQPLNAYVGTLQLGAFGQAASIQLVDQKNNLLQLALDSTHPLVFVRRIFHNRSNQPQLLRSAVIVAGVPSLKPEPTEPVLLGTGGLSEPKNARGSYLFEVIADRHSRSGVVCGWLTHDRASGIFVPAIEADQLRLTARSEYGRKLLPPGGRVDGEWLIIGWFDDIRDGLERYADLMAAWYDIHLPPKLDGYCTWYSRPHGGASDEEHLLELARFISKELAPFGMRFIQIDDGWQDGRRRNGPAKVFIRHNPAGPYPHGMAWIASRLRDLGLVPGLWLMPFAADKDDPFFADKQEWFVRDANGRPYTVRWGGTSLDLTLPTVRQYVSNVVSQAVHKWGYGYLKLDGLWTGMATSLLYINNAYREDDLGQAVFSDDRLSPIEVYRSGLALVRAAAGSGTVLLGCNVSQNMRTLGASIGFLDAMRIGPDNGPSWNALKRGPWHASNRYFLNGRVWWNDPDPVYVRASMPLEHARLICSWVAVAGMWTVSSDWLPDLPPERLDILKRILPSHNLLARPVDLLERDIPAIWIVKDIRQAPERIILGFFNWNEHEPLHIDRPLNELDLENGTVYVAYDFWNDRPLGRVAKHLTLSVPPGSCRVLALRPSASHPLVLSTSRHVTQGLVDIEAERWNEEQQQLEGTSHVVRADPYELRVWLPSTDWLVVGVQADLNGLPAACTIQHEKTLLRVRFEPAQSGALN